MTPEERARAIVDAYTGFTLGRIDLANQIASAIKDAVADALRLPSPVPPIDLKAARDRLLAEMEFLSGYDNSTIDEEVEADIRLIIQHLTYLEGVFRDLSQDSPVAIYQAGYRKGWKRGVLAQHASLARLPLDPPDVA